MEPSIIGTLYVHGLHIMIERCHLPAAYGWCSRHHQQDLSPAARPPSWWPSQPVLWGKQAANSSPHLYFPAGFLKQKGMISTFSFTQIQSSKPWKQEKKASCFVLSSLILDLRRMGAKLIITLWQCFLLWDNSIAGSSPRVSDGASLHLPGYPGQT